MNKVTFEETDDIIDICQDNVFKAVFTKDSPESERALAGLLSCLIGRQLSVITIVANEPAPDNLRDRQIRFDINCKAENGELVNVEMTMYPDDVHRRMAVQLIAFLSANDPKGRMTLSRYGLNSMQENCLRRRIFAARARPLTI